MPLDGDSMGALARLRERAEREESGAPDHFVFPVFERGKIDPMRPQRSWRSGWRPLTRQPGFPDSDLTIFVIPRCRSVC